MAVVDQLRQRIWAPSLFAEEPLFTGSAEYFGHTPGKGQVGEKRLTYPS